MTTDIEELLDCEDSSSLVPDNIRMTEAMREGLDALQREYDAFVESSFKTLALISDKQTG